MSRRAESAFPCLCIWDGRLYCATMNEGSNFFRRMATAKWEGKGINTMAGDSKERYYRCCMRTLLHPLLASCGNACRSALTICWVTLHKGRWIEGWWITQRCSEWECPRRRVRSIVSSHRLLHNRLHRSWAPTCDIRTGSPHPILIPAPSICESMKYDYAHGYIRRL